MTPPDPAERRRHRRRSVYRTAELVLRGAENGVDCTVLDISEGGVQLELGRPAELPEVLNLKLAGAAARLVRRCWAEGNRAGYRYLEILPALRRLADAPALAAPPGLVAFNDFVHISRYLLEPVLAPMDLLYPAERIHLLLIEQSIPDPGEMRAGRPIG